MSNKDRALPASQDRAAGLRPQPATPSSQSSIPSALRAAPPVDGRQQNVGMWLTEAHAEILTFFAHSCGLYRAQFMRECMNAGRRIVLEKYLGIDGAREAGKRADAIAQAIEARRAETQSGSVHESAVGNADAPKGGDA